MGKLKLVTITGADDSTSIPKLVDLSLEFPFVEWGILVSQKQEGSYRFPTRHWIDRLSNIVERNSMNVSTHVCGKWVRQLLTGELDWNLLPSSIDVCQRVQINTHAEPHVSATAMMENLAQRSKEYIFQWDGVNDHLTHSAHAYGLRVAALFDTSGGAGILPKNWPKPKEEFWCGYAGGIGPENIAEQIRIIDAICNQPYWVDMERRVRSADDSVFDLDKVRHVLAALSDRIAEATNADSR